MFIYILVFYLMAMVMTFVFLKVEEDTLISDGGL